MHRSRGLVIVVVVLSALGVGRAFAVCGDGVIDGTEKCDGANLNGKTCTKLTGGFAPGGNLVCKPDCTFDDTDCDRAFIASLVPARIGAAKNRCHLEWGTIGTVPQKGNPTRRVCNEGDKGCDQDRAFNNVCEIAIQVCLNVTDPRAAGCAASRIVELDVLKPSLAGPQGQDVTAGVLTAAQGLAKDQAAVNGNTVRYSPPVDAFKCGGGTVRIPTRGSVGHAKPGKVTIRARATDNSGQGRTVGVLTLLCMP